MNAKYTPALVRRLLECQKALRAVPSGQDYDSERDALTEAEEALWAEGWRNWEKTEELEQIAAITD